MTVVMKVEVTAAVAGGSTDVVIDGSHAVPGGEWGSHTVPGGVVRSHCQVVC